MLLLLYLSSTWLFSFASTIYLSSCSVPCFLSSLAARFQHFFSPSAPLVLSSVSTLHLLRYLSQFFLHHSYSTLAANLAALTLNVHSLLGSSSTLLHPFSTSLPLVYRPRRSTWPRNGERRRPFVYVFTLCESTCFASGTFLPWCT